MLMIAPCLAHEDGHAHDRDGFEQHGAHQHGTVTLNVALDGKRLTIELRAPADNVIGFEHAPKTEAERATLRDKSAWLRAGKGVFAFPAEAGCQLGTVELKPPEWKEGAEHADFEATISYECAQPQHLDWLGATLLRSLSEVHETRVNVLTPTRQGSDVLKPGGERVKLR